MFSLIVAFDQNRAIGFEGNLPWHLKDDLKQFKEHTIGKRIVMGNTTFQGLKKPLKDRITIVVCSEKNKKTDSDEVVYCCDFAKFLEENKDTEEEIVICGGSSIYRQSLDYCQILYISHVIGEFEADAYFPEIDYRQFKINTVKDYEGFRFVEYERLNYEKDTVLD